MSERAATTAAQPIRVSPRWSRRAILLTSFWAGVGALFAGAVAGVTNLVFPRNVAGFGGPIFVTPERVPKPGDPPRRFVEGKFWLVNLAPGEGRIGGDVSDAPGGLAALYQKCPHLGCTVPWRGEVVSPHDDERRRGWFLCPCHGSTYTRAGVRIFGPAERSMDTMAIEVNDDGTVVVQTGQITEGDLDNARRAVPWTPPSPRESRLSQLRPPAHTE